MTLLVVYFSSIESRSMSNQLHKNILPDAYFQNLYLHERENSSFAEKGGCMIYWRNLFGFV